MSTENITMSVIFEMFDAGEVSPPQQCGVHTDTHSHFVKEKMSAKISFIYVDIFYPQFSP